MRLFGLIGYPLGHSFSKKYFTQKFSDEGIADCRYELYPLQHISQLPELLAAEPDMVGLSVTIPYKEQVLSFLNEPGVTAVIGACNCIHIRNGRLWGYNTDTIGFLESFRSALRPWDTHALVLGTGGASKAVAYALGELGIAYRYVSRSGPLTYADVTPSLLEQYTVIINCSPVGTFPDVDEAPLLPYTALSERHYLFDLVYNPEKTKFLQLGEARGATIRNGYEMLRIQAEEAWRIWTTPTPPPVR